MRNIMRVRAQFSWVLLLAVTMAVGSVQAQSEVPNFADLADEHSAAVVRVEAQVMAPAPRQRRMEFQQEQQQQQMPEQMPEEMPEEMPEQLPELFRHFFGEQMPMPPENQPRRSQGSGFLISEDGYVVTNHHVVINAETIRVRTNDHRIFSAELVGSDEQSDIAVLKVEGTDLPTVSMGDSDDLRAGEWVFAIGAPFGMDYSVTAGIVSAKGRSLGERYVPFIQSDVAINPGSSGGPLFNGAGEVIGVNSQIYTRSGGFMGLSFAIPSNLTVDIVEQLQTEGSVTRGWLGIAMDPRFNEDPELAESFGLDRSIGALVVQVYEDTPAAEAGLRPGDVILEFGGQEIISFSDLAPMVGSTRPGTEVDLTVWRDGEEITLPLDVGELPDDQGMSLGQRMAPGEGQAPQQGTPADNPLGISVRDLTQQESRTVGDGGVAIAEVYEGPAEEAGLQSGDIITMIHGQFVTSVEEFRQIMGTLPEGRRVPLRVIRDGETRFIAVQLD